MTSTNIVSIAKPLSISTTKAINGAWGAKLQVQPDEYVGTESYIDLDSEEYIVKNLKKIKSAGKHYYDVSLDHNMAELGDLTIDRFSYLKTVTQLLTLILAGTGWTAGTTDINETISLVSDRRATVLEVLNLLAERCGGELYFYSKTRIVDLKRTIGTVTGLQLRYDKNCDHIEKEEDSSQLVTRIYPMGPDNYVLNTTVLDDCEDETLYAMSGGATKAASTLKQNLTQGIQFTFTALNETAIRDLGAGGVVNLTGHNSLTLFIYSDTANASGITFGIGESAYTETTVNTGALGAGCWHTIALDLSGVADASKNAIRYIGFKNLTNGAAVVVVDTIRAFSGLTYIDSPNRTLYKVNKEYTYIHSAKPEKTSYELILNPTDDAQVRSNQATTNFGSATYSFIYDQGGTDLNQCFMKFSLSQIPTGAAIVSAVLSVYCPYIYGAGNSDVQLHSVTGADWVEETLTYNNKPAYGAEVAHIDITSIGWKTCDIKTALIDGWWGGTANYGFAMVTNPSADANYVQISTKEITNKPYLTITYTTTTNPSPVIEAAARQYLADHDEPILKYKVKVADLSKAMANTWEDETINLGDTLRIYDKDLGINVDVRVVKITKDLIHSENITLELGNKAYSLIDIQAKQAKQLAYSMPYQDNTKIVEANAIQTGYFGSNVNV
jgi:hypothetical protein